MTTINEKPFNALRVIATWYIWQGMWKRCIAPSAKKYAMYGGRGIKVCERWKDFNLFYADLGPRPGYAYSIERDDVNGNYEPGNCRWALSIMQPFNRQNTYYVEYKGKKQSLAVLAIKAGIRSGVVRGRVRRGWDVERALTEPVAASTKPVTKNYNERRGQSSDRQSRLKAYLEQNS